LPDYPLAVADAEDGSSRRHSGVTHVMQEIGRAAIDAAARTIFE
jgi:hypothetical protein